MSTILVMGAMNDEALHPATAEVAALALRLGAKLSMPVIGVLPGPSTSEARHGFGRLGFSEAFAIIGGGALQPIAEQQLSALAALVASRGVTLVLAPHTFDTAEWLPLLGGCLQAAVATDCQNVDVVGGRLLITKMIFGGAIGAEYFLNRPIGVVTITPGVFQAEAATEPCPVQTIEVHFTNSAMQVIEEVREEAGVGVALKQATIVVAGGLGLRSRENWSLVTETAKVLGAAVGATRAVVDSGWVSSAYQVGYSGAKIAPNLYIAIGISGAIHHLAGIAQAKNVVAINNDAGAEIFKVARIGVVGDASTVVPAFCARLGELRSSSGKAGRSNGC